LKLVSDPKIIVAQVLSLNPLRLGTELFDRQSFLFPFIIER
jgi:hypothetical protein